LSEDIIQLGDLAIHPCFDRALKPIHPAIGTIDDTAYVGVWIPCQVESTDKRGSLKTVEKDLLFLITDKREKILANDDVLSKKGWKLVYKPIFFENRWSLDDVKRFLTEQSSPIDALQVLQRVVDVWMTYLELPSLHHYLYEALWDIGTYFHHLFNCYPYDYKGGPKRTGKSKALTVSSSLSFNAVFSNNMSVSSIYRLIQNARCTLLIDETEKLRNPDRAQEFRSILLAGYKNGERVYRVERDSKEKLVPEGFEVYAPKRLANIGGLEDVLEDRCVVSFLRRSINRAIVDREINTSDPLWSELRSELYRLYLGYWHEIQVCYDRLSELSEANELVNFLRTTVKDIKEEDFEHLTARELELWKPLLALAMFFDSKGAFHSSKFTCSLSSLTSFVIKLAVEHARQKQTENMTETGELILIQTLLKAVAEDNYYKVKSIKEGMAASFDEEQNWLTTKWIGNALRRLGFKEKRRVGTGYEYKLNVADVRDLAQRMQIDTIAVETGSTLASNKLPCEVCGSFEAKMHLIPDKGVHWLCDPCLETYPGKV